MKPLFRFIIFVSLAILASLNGIYAQSTAYLSSITQNLLCPIRVAIGNTNNIYVNDASKKIINKYDTSGNLIQTISPGGSPLSIAINRNNQVFFGDGETGNILKVNPNATTSVFYTGTVFPCSMVFCPDSLLYVVDSKLNVVVVINESGNVVRTIGGGILFYPTGIAYNPKTNRIIISEHGGIENASGTIIEKVWIFDLQGNLISSFGQYGSTNGRFYRIQGLAVDRCGNIYVSDPFQGKVSIFNENGVFISKFGIFGNALGQMNVPLDIAINSNDRIWIASMNNGSIEVYKINFALPTSNITSGTTTICSGNTANIPISFTGTSPWTFTYTVDNLNPTTVSGVTSNPYILTVSQAGAYQVTALSNSSSSGTCFSGVATIRIDSIIPTANISSGNASVCSGDTAGIQIDFTGTPPWTIAYTINNLNPTTVSNITNSPYLLNATQAGTYQLTSLSGAGCSGTSFAGSADITFNPLPIVNAGIDQTVCSGRQVTLSGNGASSYNWNNAVINGVAFTPTSTANYIVTGTNAVNGCTNSDTVLVVVNPIITRSDTVTFCQGNTYRFGTQSLTSSGIYIETFTTSNGCDSVVTLTLNVTPVATGTIAASICQGSTYTFGTQLFNTSGTFIGIFPAANGCDSVVTLTLNVNPTITETTTVSICQGNTYSFGSQTLTVDGTYTGTFANANGCDSVVTLTLNVNSPTTGNLAVAICQGNTYSFGSQSLTTAGTYTETFTAANGCDSVVTLTLNVNSPTTGNLAASICQGNSYSFGSQALTTAGTYTETLTAASGCDSVVTLNLSVNSPTTGNLAASICQGNTYSFGSQSLTTTGTYIETFTAANGCDSVVTLTLNVNPLPIASILGNTSICSGDATTLTATGGVAYLWNTLDTIASITVSPVTSNMYCVTVADNNNGCAANACVTVNVNTPPSLLVNNVIAASCSNCCDGSASVSATGLAPYVYQWSPGGQTTSSVTNLCVGTHTVCVTDANGCSICDTVLIDFSTGINLPSTSNELQFAVYPNPSSGQVTLEIINPDQLELSIEIYDVLGQKIYSKVFNGKNIAEQIDLSGFANGMYSIKMSANDLTRTGKLILSK